MRSVLTGVGVALAVSIPAVALAAILVTLNDDGDRLPPLVRLLVLIAVLVGPAAGGGAIARQGASRGLSVTVGAIALLAVAALGLVRQAVDADADPNLAVVPLSLFVGATLGWVGGALGQASPARTRR